MMDTESLDPAPSIFARVDLHDRKITLYDWMLPGVSDGRNLICTDRDGNLLWRAVPPFLDNGADCFTGIRWDGSDLTVWSWSCYKAKLDPQTGKLSDLVFTK
jgi:hypothetical protein